MALLDPSTLAGPTLVVAVCGLVYVESGLLVGFFLPGDTVLFAAGLACAAPATGVSAVLLAGLVAVAAVAGDATGYLLGRRLGRPALQRRAGRRVGPETLARAEDLYARFGPLAVVSARWIPWVRTFTPLLAGAARMPYARFAAANVVGALSWGAGLVLLGRYSADAPGVKRAAIGVAVAVVVLSVVVPLVLAGRRRLRTRRALEPAIEPTNLLK